MPRVTFRFLNRRPPGRLLKLLALGLVLVSGCGQPNAGGELTIRFIQQEPRELFDRTELLGRAPLDVWRFEEPRDLRMWQPSAFDQRFEIRDRGLILRSSKKRPRLTRSVDWDSASVDALEIKLAKLERGSVRVRWAREGESFSAERSVAGRREAGGYLIDLASQPLWTGRIRRLQIELRGSTLRARGASRVGPRAMQIELRGPRGRENRLESIRLLEYLPTSERLADAVARPWKVDLDHEVRTCSLGLPEIPVEHSLTVPARAKLRFGFGIDSGTRVAVEFAASISVSCHFNSSLTSSPTDLPDRCAASSGESA